MTKEEVYKHINKIKKIIPVNFKIKIETSYKRNFNLLEPFIDEYKYIDFYFYEHNLTASHELEELTLTILYNIVSKLVDTHQRIKINKWYKEELRKNNLNILLKEAE